MGNENTVLTKEEIREKQDSLRVLRADLTEFSDTQELHVGVFNRPFMSKYTLRYDSFRKFIANSPSKVQNGELQNAEDIDNFVSKETVFDSWYEMKEKAIEEWIANNARLD